MILVLDDYHLIHNKEIHGALDYWFAHSSPRLHIVILTRSDPPLELARLRVTGQLVEIRMEHLRFSTREAGAFLQNVAGVTLDENEVVALNGRTEGWVAGLQMAAISLARREDVAAFVAAFAGKSPLYLRLPARTGAQPAGSRVKGVPPENICPRTPLSSVV